MSVTDETSHRPDILIEEGALLIGAGGGEHETHVGDA